MNNYSDHIVAFSEAINALLDELGVKDEQERSRLRAFTAAKMGYVLGTLALNNAQIIANATLRKRNENKTK